MQMARAARGPTDKKKAEGLRPHSAFGAASGAGQPGEGRFTSTKRGVTSSTRRLASLSGFDESRRASLPLPTRLQRFRVEPCVLTRCFATASARRWTASC